MNSFSEEDVDIRMQTAEEIISGIIMYSAELKRSGKTGEELRQIMEQIKIFAGQEGVPEQMNELLEHAVLAVERTFPAEDSDRYEVPSDSISSES